MPTLLFSSHSNNLPNASNQGIGVCLQILRGLLQLLLGSCLLVLLGSYLLVMLGSGDIFTYEVCARV